MIYSDKFVWLHFPRCAGTKVEHLFQKYYAENEDIVQDATDPSNTDARNVIWHDTIEEREARDANFSLGNRVVICSFRRLRPWLISRYNFEYLRSPYLNHNPELLLEGKILEQTGKLNHADWYARVYIPRSLLFSGRIRFIRTEHFAMDFRVAFGEFIDLSKIPEKEFERKVNVAKNFVPYEIQHKLYSNREIYDHCPYWKLVEEIAYGFIED